MSVAAATNAGLTDDEIIHRIREQDAAGELPTPAPPEAVAELETAEGHPMPPLLKRIYLEVADGGFGRWGEALSLTDTTYSFSDSGRLLEEYLGGAQSPTTRRLLYRSWRGAVRSGPSSTTAPQKAACGDGIPTNDALITGTLCSPKTSHWPNGSAGGWTDGRTSRRPPLARTAQIAETAALQCGCIPVTTPPGSLARLTGQPKRPAQ